MLEVIRDDWLLLLIGSYPHGPLGGLAATLLLALLGLALSFPCAMLIALGRLSPFRPARMVATAVVTVVRGTPFLIVLFWSYFLLPSLIGRPIGGFPTLVGALVLYESSYLAEVIRAGIQALPRGQTEAARSLGIGYWRTMADVVLPQALLNALPSLISQFVSIIKETSLGSVVSVNEFTFEAAQVNGMLLTKPVQVFSLLAATYFLLCFTLTSAARAVERRILRARADNRASAAGGRAAVEPLATEATP